VSKADKDHYTWQFFSDKNANKTIKQLNIVPSLAVFYKIMLKNTQNIHNSIQHSIIKSTALAIGTSYGWN
jgi:hypothetical protein